MSMTIGHTFPIWNLVITLRWRNGRKEMLGKTSDPGGDNAANGAVHDHYFFVDTAPSDGAQCRRGSERVGGRVC